jgi:hypothetical protein
MTMSFGPRKKRKPLSAPASPPSQTASARPQTIKSSDTYRARSLKIHGWICAKCAREFDESNIQSLTVHHKDGNHKNNPPDGSNWENLCSYCHDDEHSRGILGDYISGKNK